MTKIVRNEIEYSSTTSPANQISYLNTTSGLSATNVQGAIDEVAGDIPANATDLPISSSDSTDTKSYIDNGLSEKADIDNLSTVATSGSYSDLNDTPIQLKNNILQGQLLNYFNASSIVLDLDVAATNDRTWQAFIFNANQSFMFICNFGTTLSKTRLTGTAELTLTYSNDNKRVTITPASTAWGVTTILLVYFDRL